jgi:translation elongation factor EF-Ts
MSKNKKGPTEPVIKLSKLTGYGLIECRKCLQRNNWNIKRAQKEIRIWEKIYLLSSLY